MRGEREIVRVSGVRERKTAREKVGRRERWLQRQVEGERVR